MPVHAHAYTFGVQPLAVHDRIVEALAVGAVLATVAWLATVASPPSLEQLRVRYSLAPAYLGDAEVQHVRLGAALTGCAVTCLDLAIYEAALCHVQGVEAWVEIVRRSDDESAHAIVVFPSAPQREIDPSARFARLESTA